jgi:hypothetical protein
VERLDEAFDLSQVRSQIGCSKPVAFHSDHARASNDCRGNGKKSSACVQVNNFVGRTDLGQHMSHKIAQQKSIALKKRLDVPAHSHLMAVEVEDVRHVGITSNHHCPAVTGSVTQTHPGEL